MKSAWFILLLLPVLTLTGCGASGSGREGWRLFDGARSFAHLEAQVGFGPRVPGTEAHRKCLDYFREYLSPLADSVETDNWLHITVSGDTLPLANIRASFNPGAERRILLCAHWDSRPRAEQDQDPSNRALPIPGANDGASGVAVLLEAARVFSFSPPRLGVDIVLFDGEDYGDFYRDEDVLLGSRRFASRAGKYKPELGILLDLVGDKNARFPMEGHSWASLPQDCRRVWDTAARLGYGQLFPAVIGNPVVDDHLPLMSAGIRCIDIIQIDDLPYWHTLGDTPDKCSPRTLEAVGKTVTAVVYEPGS